MTITTYQKSTGNCVRAAAATRDTHSQSPNSITPRASLRFTDVFHESLDRGVVALAVIAVGSNRPWATRVLFCSVQLEMDLLCRILLRG